VRWRRTQATAEFEIHLENVQHACADGICDLHHLLRRQLTITDKRRGPLSKCSVWKMAEQGDGVCSILDGISADPVHKMLEGSALAKASLEKLQGKP
jgi:hypothetical protein